MSEVLKRAEDELELILRVVFLLEPRPSGPKRSNKNYFAPRLIILTKTEGIRIVGGNAYA